jgi:hypothetical protein
LLLVVCVESRIDITFKPVINVSAECTCTPSMLAAWLCEQETLLLGCDQGHQSISLRSIKDPTGRQLQIRTNAVYGFSWSNVETLQ